MSNFISVTTIGRQLCLSYQKVNKILAENNLYIKETKRASEFALENGFAKMKTAVSRFSGKPVEFILWNFDKLQMMLPIPSRVEKAARCRNSMDAFDKICNAMADFGDILKIDPGVQKRGISSEAHYAVVQAYFIDPNYLRGTLLWHRHFHPEEAEYAKNITLKLARELFKAASKIDAARAKSNMRSLEIIMQWLCENAH